MRKAVAAAFIVLAISAVACGGADDPATSSSVPAAASSSITPTSSTTTAPTTSAAATSTTAPGTSTSAPPTTSSTTAAPTTGALIAIPVGDGGVEYRGSGDEQEITGPSLIAVDAGNGIHIYDPTANRILSFRGAARSSIDLAALDIASVTAMAGADDLVLVEIFFSPVRHRVHRVSFDGALTETIELPEGFRLEDGLSGVRVGSDGEIVLEFEGGAFFGVFDAADSTFTNTTVLRGAVEVVATPPDLEIAGRRITADLTMGLGALRYLGTASDGVHLVVRQDVLALDPVITVVTSVEWYDPDGSLLGAARVPGLEEQYISTPPGIAMLDDATAVALVALENEIKVIVLDRQEQRITE